MDVYVIVSICACKCALLFYCNQHINSTLTHTERETEWNFEFKCAERTRVTYFSRFTGISASFRHKHTHTNINTKTLVYRRAAARVANDYTLTRQFNKIKWNIFEKMTHKRDNTTNTSNRSNRIYHWNLYAVWCAVLYAMGV